jgi:hypothetical protein
MAFPNWLFYYALSMIETDACQESEGEHFWQPRCTLCAVDWLHPHDGAIAQLLSSDFLYLSSTRRM